jgi:AcrR family transcriptional regulator
MAASRARSKGRGSSRRDDAGPSLREDLKRRTRAKLESAAVRLIKKHGFRATSVDQIARAAGTTRTTFYQYFKSKGALIHFMQQEFIAPGMIAICKRLDDLVNPTWQDLRDWVTEYSTTWEHLHLFFEAYNEAATTDPEVAAAAIPQTYDVTAHMNQLLERFEGAERQRVHDKLVILISVISQMLALTKGQRDDPRNSHLLDNFTDLFWDAMFSRLPPAKDRPSAKADDVGQGSLVR